MYEDKRFRFNVGRDTVKLLMIWASMKNELYIALRLFE